MALSPFTFYRGSALNMAVDLARTPATGVRVQCCGDAHLGNFRGLGTPERRIIFAINDLDETLPAPWEWDLKRLAASFVVVCRNNGLSEDTAREAALTCVRSYREHMHEFSDMSALDRWYRVVDSEALLATVDDPELRKRGINRMAKERTRRVEEDLFPSFKRGATNTAVIRDQFPTIYHWKGHKPGKIHADTAAGFALFRESLPDASFTRSVRSCGMPRSKLSVSQCRHGLRRAPVYGWRWQSPLPPGQGGACLGCWRRMPCKSVFPNHGQRVVNGQRLMQPASDRLLGWGRTGAGHSYIRQLRDIKLFFAVETFGVSPLLLDAGGAVTHSRSRMRARAIPPS